MVRIPTYLEKEHVKSQLRFMDSKVQKIGKKRIKQLAKRAARNRKRAYTPYSKYQVGSVVLTKGGDIFDGANIEVVTYSETIHAEEFAITVATFNVANMEGRKFLDFLVVSHEEDSDPCGHCRQVILEHCDNALIAVADAKGDIRRLSTIQLLQPSTFTPTHLGIE